MIDVEYGLGFWLAFIGAIGAIGLEGFQFFQSRSPRPVEGAPPPSDAST